MLNRLAERTTFLSAGEMSVLRQSRSFFGFAEDPEAAGRGSFFPLLNYVLDGPHIGLVNRDELRRRANTGDRPCLAKAGCGGTQRSSQSTSVRAETVPVRSKASASPILDRM